MKLRDYLADRKKSYAAFAARIGVRQAKSIGRYVNGERIPQKKIMDRIVLATGGLVQPGDFYDPEPAEPAGRDRVEAAAEA